MNLPHYFDIISISYYYGTTVTRLHHFHEAITLIYTNHLDLEKTFEALVIRK